METPIGDDEDSHLGDFIEDTNVESPIDATTNTNPHRRPCATCSPASPPREAKVLRMRFGIDMNTDHTLEEVGAVRRDARAHPPDRGQALRKLPSQPFETLRSFLDIE